MKTMKTMKSLPVIKTPTYLGKIPSSGKSFEFRPFLTGEQKILLIALESENINNIYLAFRNIINTCVTSPISSLISPEIIERNGGGLENLPAFDVESIFLQITAKSAGEISRVGAKCTSCEKNNIVEVNLNDIQLKNANKKKDNDKIMLTDSVGIKMRYPSMKSLFEKETADNNEEAEEKNSENTQDLVQRTIRASIECIFDENEVYLLEDTSQEEIDKFFDSLTMEQNEKIESFFDHSPYLASDVKFTCSHCGAKNSSEIKGLRNFF